MISLVIERMPPLNLLQSLTQKLECRLAPAWELARRDQSEVFPRLSLLEHKTSRLSMPFASASAFYAAAFPDPIRPFTMCMRAACVPHAAVAVARDLALLRASLGE